MYKWPLFKKWPYVQVVSLVKWPLCTGSFSSKLQSMFHYESLITIHSSRKALGTSKILRFQSFFTQPSQKEITTLHYACPPSLLLVFTTYITLMTCTIIKPVIFFLFVFLSNIQKINIPYTWVPIKNNA